MIIASPQKLRKPTVLHLSVNDINIQNVDVVRYLGIFIDNHLSWAHQIQTVIASAKQKLFAISRLSLPRSVMITLYKAFVMPVLEYGCIAWWPTTTQQSISIDRIHRLAVRLFGYYPPVTPSMRRDYIFAKQIYKSLEGISPSYLCGVFQPSKNTRSSSTKRLFIPSVRTNYGKASFHYRGAVFWNKLGSELHCCTSQKSFDKLYKEKFIES